MFGVLRIALKLLVNDKGKFVALLMGITFAVFLMIIMTSMFSGILVRASGTVLNVGAKVWVMDPAVNNVASNIPMPDFVLNSARSIDGVEFAVPMYSSAALVKLQDGTFQAVSVIGLDDFTLFGRPDIIEGNLDDIFAENAFLVVKDSEYAKLESPKVGTVFEINDNRAVVVGLASVTTPGLFGIPTVYTTYRRAISYIPTGRFTISYILIEPKSPEDIPHIQQEIAKLGYQALTKDGFIEKIKNFYKYQTGLGMNILLMTAISFLVGLSISGQTFYTFVLENIEKFGALKAIGARGRDLVAMIMFQALFTGLIGFGLGVGLATTMMVTARLRLPDYASQITYGNIVLAFGAVLVMAAFSSYIGVRKVLQIQPFDIFRG